MADDHERTRREQAAAIAGLEVQARNDHEFLEAVNRKQQDMIHAVQGLEVQQVQVASRVANVEAAQTRLEDGIGNVRKEGSGRMAKIEVEIKQEVLPRIKAVENHQLRTTAYVSGAVFAATLFAKAVFDWLPQFWRHQP